MVFEIEIARERAYRVLDPAAPLDVELPSLLELAADVAGLLSMVCRSPGPRLVALALAHFGEGASGELPSEVWDAMYADGLTASGLAADHVYAPSLTASGRDYLVEEIRALSRPAPVDSGSDRDAADMAVLSILDVLEEVAAATSTDAGWVSLVRDTFDLHRRDLGGAIPSGATGNEEGG